MAEIDTQGGIRESTDAPVLPPPRRCGRSVNSDEGWGDFVDQETSSSDRLARRCDLRTRALLGELLVLPEAWLAGDPTITTVLDGRLCLVGKVFPAVTQVGDAETGLLRQGTEAWTGCP
jgi:hypothetical protein